MSYSLGNYDVIVIGAGHAGCEAALASARLGKKTAIFVINMETLANMPCNPSIGGTSKGHLVREIDALGGEMAKNADKTFIQSKMLNMSKGPAVHSLRVQSDRKMYHIEMKKTLENQENLDLYQAEIVEILVNNEKNKVIGVKTKIGAEVYANQVIVATGTYLKGKVIIGEISYESGPDGVFPANDLSQSLLDIGVELRRFKTGTPARINANIMNFDEMEVQHGDEKIVPFSFENEGNEEITNKKQVDCYLTYTNENTHEIILNNLDRSPIYSGKIHGIGPRYCPSIEDKVVRFRDKKRHQLFIEPLGEKTSEMYIQGMSSSLPEEVQIKMYRTVPGLENAKLMRPAYAIEYDCIDSTNLKLSLEYKGIDGLFFAGQVNGSSGYEEAAAQGIIAGINAARKSDKKDPLILDRSQAYIGVLIDDLVTKGTNEPYRMMTSRSEYRLMLRQDNADIRLTPIGHQIGLISDERYNKFLNKQKLIHDEIDRLNKQVNAELYSGYLYLSMASYFEDDDLPGFANWMRVQAQEELEHGMKIYDYIIRRGGSVKLDAIEGPQTEWDSPLAAFEHVLSHEQTVTGLINNLVDIAITEKDHATNNFLQWFVEEQVEEEENAMELVGKVKRAQNSVDLMYTLDSELASRVYTPPADKEN